MTLGLSSVVMVCNVVFIHPIENLIMGEDFIGVLKIEQKMITTFHKVIMYREHLWRINFCKKLDHMDCKLLVLSVGASYFSFDDQKYFVLNFIYLLTFTYSGFD